MKRLAFLLIFLIGCRETPTEPIKPPPITIFHNTDTVRLPLYARWSYRYFDLTPYDSVQVTYHLQPLGIPIIFGTSINNEDLNAITVVKGLNTKEFTTKMYKKILRDSAYFHVWASDSFVIRGVRITGWR